MQKHEVKLPVHKSNIICVRFTLVGIMIWLWYAIYWLKSEDPKCERSTAFFWRLHFFGDCNVFLIFGRLLESRGGITSIHFCASVSSSDHFIRCAGVILTLIPFTFASSILSLFGTDNIKGVLLLLLVVGWLLYNFAINLQYWNI